MKGKIVNLCFGFLNLLFGALILIFTLKVPQDIKALTIQEGVVVDKIIIGIYVVMFIIAIIDIIQGFNHKTDTTFHRGYLIGVFAISFYFFKSPYIAAFSLLSGVIVLYKSLKENLIELDSTTAISFSIILIGAIIILGVSSLNYATFGQIIKNSENIEEQKYTQDFFKYITELDITDIFINVKKDGKFGYINQNGDVMIDYIYDYASPFVKITSYDKIFYVALVCKDGSSSIILKNQRKVLSYKTESSDENYEAKIEELKNIYTNTLKQTDPMEYEVLPNTININKIPINEISETDNVKVFNYNAEYNIEVTQSSFGKNDIYELVKKEDSRIRIRLDTDNLDYDDNYLYLFENGYIPFYEVTKSIQGWFTNYGKKREVTGRAQLLEVFYDSRILLKDHKSGIIYFVDSLGNKLSDDYYDLYICGDGRYIVKDSDNYFKIINDQYEQIFEKKYAVFNTRFIKKGLYLVMKSTDNIKFNDYGYADVDWTLLNYDGEEIATNIEYIYDLDLKINKVKNIDEENYLLFTTNLKKLNYKFVGDKFYTNKEQ